MTSFLMHYNNYDVIVITLHTNERCKEVTVALLTGVERMLTSEIRSKSGVKSKRMHLDTQPPQNSGL